MAKFSSFVFAIAGFVIIFHIFGLAPPSTFTGGLIALLTDPINIKASQLANVSIFGGTSILAGIYLAAGSLLRNTTYKADFVIFSVLVPIFAGWGVDLIQIFDVVYNISKALAVLVFSPMILVYFIGIIDWWRGTST